MTRMIVLAALVLATPASAAVEGKPFFSLYNTDLVVALGFTVFIGILVYFKVPGMLFGMLDRRAATIAAELDEARRLREEAQELRASFERKKTEVKEQAERIIANARADAEEASKLAKAELEASIARRLKAAEEQILSAEQAAVRAVRNQAVAVAVAAAADVIAKNLSAADAGAIIDASIQTVEARLH
jgi:F-type H+-transporting ATPase subunit b